MYSYLTNWSPLQAKAVQLSDDPVVVNLEVIIGALGPPLPGTAIVHHKISSQLPPPTLLIPLGQDEVMFNPHQVPQLMGHRHGSPYLSVVGPVSSLGSSFSKFLVDFNASCC